jgi:hypothetical protein
MLSKDEIALYLKGLWLLIKGDAMGSRYLDISERGFKRSFLAPVICLPALFVSWMWWAKSFQAITGQEALREPIFYLRLALVEAICWLVPLILMGLMLQYFKSGHKFTAIVTCTNWLSVPFTYLYAALILIAFILPFLQATIALIFMGLHLGLVIAYSRIIRFFIRDQGLLVFGLVMTLLVPQMLLSEWLQRFLGIYPV